MKKYLFVLYLFCSTNILFAQDAFLWPNADSEEANRRYEEIYAPGGEGYERNQRIQQYNQQIYQQQLGRDKLISDNIQKKIDAYYNNRNKTNTKPQQNNRIEKRSGGLLIEHDSPQKKKVVKNKRTKNTRQTNHTTRVNRVNTEIKSQNNNPIRKHHNEKSARIQRDRVQEYNRLGAVTRRKSEKADWHTGVGVEEMKRLHNSQDIMHEGMSSLRRNTSSRQNRKSNFKSRANRPGEWKLDPYAKLITQDSSFNAVFRKAQEDFYKEYNKKIISLRPVKGNDIWSSMPQESREINLAKMFVECNMEYPEYKGFNSESNSFIFESNDGKKIFSIEKDGSSYLSLTYEEEKQTDIIQNLKDNTKIGASLKMDGIEGKAELNTKAELKGSISYDDSPSISITSKNVSDLYNFATDTKQNSFTSDKNIDFNVTSTQNDDSKDINKLNFIKIYAKSKGYTDLGKLKIEYSRILPFTKNYSAGVESGLYAGIDVDAKAELSMSGLSSKIENNFATIPIGGTYVKRNDNGEIFVVKRRLDISASAGLSLKKTPIPGLSIDASSHFEMHKINFK